jgi:succinyl-CoA synthetase alpha subunit
VYDSVREAAARHPLEASVISVPPFAVRDAAYEAIENGIRLIVIVTERVPRRDVAEVLAFASERGARIIGPNSLGVIRPSRSKLGGIGGSLDNTRRSFTPGGIGVMSRSGGMTCEIANLLTQHGLGQSTCVSIGGDPMIGSSYDDLFPLFQDDPETRAVVLFAEPGGSGEEQFARSYAARPRAKPVVAFVAGKFVDGMPGRRFGHAAVIVEGGRGGTRGKIEALRGAGIVVAENLSDLPALLREALASGHVH